MRVLMMGGDPGFALGILRDLRQSGHSMDWTGGASEAIAELYENDYDVIILDLDFPEGHAARVLSRCQTEGIESYIVALHESGRARLQADACTETIGHRIEKPFASSLLISLFEELVPGHGPQLSSGDGDLRIDMVAHRAYVGDTVLRLGPREFNLLKAFVREPNRVFTRSDLLHLIWGRESQLSDNAVDVQIHRLRAKIGRHRILTLRDHGYRLSGFE